MWIKNNFEITVTNCGFKDVFKIFKITVTNSDFLHLKKIYMDIYLNTKD